MGPKEELAENVLSLFKSSEYSDLTITMRDKTFKVHQALICSRSEYFRKACKDGAWKEGQNKAINIQHDQDMPVPMDDPVFVEYMLRYLYGLDYMEEPGEEDDLFNRNYSKGVSSGGNAAVHAQMCAIADFYGVPDLQKAAQRKFRAAFNKIYDNQGIVTVFKIVCDPNFRSDAVLRDIMVGKIATDNDLLDEQEVEEILRKDGELALAIAKHMR